MAWTLTDSIETYAAAVTPLLNAEPERYTVIMGVLAALVEHGPNVYGAEPPVLGWWSQNGAVSAAVLQTPPHPIQITSLPADAVGPLVEALAPGHADSITQVLGKESDATMFAQAWAPAAGRQVSVEMRQRLHRLGELTPPDPMPYGSARVATSDDVPFAYAVDDAFSAETGQRPASPALIESRLHTGRLMLWEVDGQPVSAAGLSALIAGVARIGQVYTPPEHRNRGYGAAVTVATTRLAFDYGASSVILFTDLANPTSNALYARLGYRPVEDKVVLAFRSAQEAQETEQAQEASR
jgi:predicted GNAT family acetyltransferase